MFSTFLRYIPKIGPFKALAFNNPTARTEDLYIKSINTTVDQIPRISRRKWRADTLVLPNFDLDSGQATKANEYSLTDKAYAKLLTRVAVQEVQSDDTGASR